MKFEDTACLDLMERGQIGYHDVMTYRADRENVAKHYWKFGAQVVISGVVIAFSLAMTATHPGTEGVYIPIVTSILGFWIPSPDIPPSLRPDPVSSSTVSPPPAPASVPVDVPPPPPPAPGDHAHVPASASAPAHAPHPVTGGHVSNGRIPIPPLPIPPLPVHASFGVSSSS